MPPPHLYPGPAEVPPGGMRARPVIQESARASPKSLPAETVGVISPRGFLSAVAVLMDQLYHCSAPYALWIVSRVRQERASMQRPLSSEAALTQVKYYTGLDLSADDIMSLYEILTVPRKDTAIFKYLRKAKHPLGVELEHLPEGGTGGIESVTT